MASDELRVVADLLCQAPPDRLDSSIEEQRAEWERVSSLFPLAADVSCTPVMAGDVPAEWVAVDDALGAPADRHRDELDHSHDAARPDRVLLYLHGGGYAIGSVVTHRDLAARLSAASGARVLVVDYRLAPEHPFPAAVDDARAAYRWLLAQGVDPRHVAVAGDSAGGGLALATSVALRDEGAASPAAVVCFSPWVDLALTGASMQDRADREIVISPRWVAACADRYLRGADPRYPLASPLYAELRGLCPLLVLVGTEEILFDDAGRLVERAAGSGVDVDLEVYESCFHLWMVLAPFAPEAADATERAGAFLRRHLA